MEKLNSDLLKQNQDAQTAIALAIDYETSEAVGHFFIDLTNDLERSIVNITGAIALGYSLEIRPDIPEVRETFQEFLLLTDEMRFDKE